MKTILDAQNLTKIYGLDTKHPVQAISDISLTIHEGEFVVIMGPSGSGKSTLLNNISTIDIPTKGHLYINDSEIQQMSENQLGKFRFSNLGFIFQDYNLLDSLTIYENIMIPLKLGGYSTSEIDKKIHEITQKLDIEGLLDKYPFECSGGQQQRVAIARALVTHPKLIVADEPTGNLDSKNSHDILTMFKELNDKEGITIVMVTHDPMIASYSSRFLYIKDGVIDQTLERNDLKQEDYFYKIVDINSHEMQSMFSK